MSPHLSKIYLNIILPPTCGSSWWSLSYGIPTKIIYAFLFSTMRATCPAQRILDLIIRNIFRPFWIGNVSDKCLAVWTLLHVLYKHILISLTTFWVSHAEVFVTGMDKKLCITYCFIHIPSEHSKHYELSQFKPIYSVVCFKCNRYLMGNGIL
jgi:hypothetical protein